MVRIWVVGDATPLEFAVDAVVLHEVDDTSRGSSGEEMLRVLTAGKRVLLVNPAALVALEASP